MWLIASLFIGCGEEEQTVSFSNLPPFSPIIDLQPSVPYTGDDLVAIPIVDSIDPDGDEVTLQYLWYKDDVLQEDITGEIVSSDLTSRGEIWTVAVISSDDSLSSADTRRSVTIRNSIPMVDAVVLEWVDADGNPVADAGTPAEDSILSEHVDQHIRATVEASDGDPSDELTVNYQWIVDGAALDLDSDTLPYSEMMRGQDWVLEITVNDGLTDSELHESFFGFFNAKPQIAQEDVVISYDSLDVGGTLTCEATATDDDDDVGILTYSYSWTVTTEIIDSEPLVQTVEGNVLETRNFASGSSVSCIAIANDGMDDSDAVESTAVILTGNSLPVVDVVEIIPADAEIGFVVGQTLTCNAEASDYDGDEVTLSYSWTVGNEEVSTTDTFDTTGQAAGNFVVCTVVANDGMEDSDAVFDEVELSAAN